MKILVAGIGNIFLGDDGFGTEVARRLAVRDLPSEVRVMDFGIRGMDLAYALMDGYVACIFVDIAACGEAAGTLYLMEHQSASEPQEVSLNAHGMDPLKILAMARAMGAPPTRIFIIACEPQFIVDAGENYEDVVVELSAPVRAAIPGALEMTESLVKKILSEQGDKTDANSIEIGGADSSSDDHDEAVARPYALSQDA